MPSRQRTKPVLVFDLDHTLIDASGRPYPQTRGLLNQCTKEGYTCAIASLNIYAVPILKNLRLSHSFHVLVGDYDALLPYPKLYHLALIRQRLRVAHARDMILFDDLRINVHHGRQAGYLAVQVDPRVGLTNANLKHGLRQWKQRRRKR